MSIFSGLFRSRDKPTDSTTGSTYRFLFGGTTSGKAVTERSAMNDSVFDLETYIASEFGRRIGAAEEEAFLTGDGSKKPEGIFTKVAATKGATTEITGSTVSFDNIMADRIKGITVEIGGDTTGLSKADRKSTRLNSSHT